MICHIGLYKNAIELAKVVLFTSGVDDLTNKENDKVKQTSHPRLLSAYSIRHCRADTFAIYYYRYYLSQEKKGK